MRIPHRISRTLADLRTSRWSRERPFDEQEVLVVSGEPRGGSTWLAELLTLDRSTTLLWEPLDIDRSRYFRRLGFWNRQPIPPDADWPEARELFARLFRGELRDGFITGHTTRERFEHADTLVVKFVRANMLIDRLASWFPEVRGVVVVRHPCAVVNSQLQSGSWRTVPVRFDKPAGRYMEFFDRFGPQLANIRTLEERLAAFWVMDQWSVLGGSFSAPGWTVVHYEHLVLEREERFARLLAFLGLGTLEQVLAHADRPSASTVKESSLRSGGPHLGHWRERLAPDRQQRIMDMVRSFGVGTYGPGDLPEEPCS